MKEFISKYQKAIVGTGAVAVLIVCYLQQKELAKLRAQPKIEVYTGGDIQKGKAIDSLTNLTDSLRDELFIERIDAGRHEITREEILGKYPKIAKEYDEFYSHNTE
jgi:hypothetical protein